MVGRGKGWGSHRKLNLSPRWKRVFKCYACNGGEVPLGGGLILTNDAQWLLKPIIRLLSYNNVDFKKVQ